MTLAQLDERQTADCSRTIVLLIQVYQEQPVSEHRAEVLRALVLVLNDLTETNQQRPQQ